MGIRIQPLDIEVPEKDPFKNDLLGRKETVQVLTNLAGSIEGPCVIAVDSAWGTGKTTFLKIWSQHLRNVGFPVVEFNAWETDFTGDPLVALAAELSNGLGELSEVTPDNIKRLQVASRKILRLATPIVVKAATGGLVDLKEVLEQFRRDTDTYADERLRQYHEGKDYVAGFKAALQSAASTLSTCRDNRPLIVLIDELDRCRPTYAVELLEAAKHLFSVDDIIFVIAVNRVALAHSIKSLYGRGFDAEGYLRRFVDVDFELPSPDRSKFISNTLDMVKFDSFSGLDPQAKNDLSYGRFMLSDFLGKSDLSLRLIAREIRRLGLVFGSLDDNELRFANAAILAIIIRAIDSSLYSRFVRGDADDSEVVAQIVGDVNSDKLNFRATEHKFEASVILAHEEVKNSLGGAVYKSERMKRYEALLNNGALAIQAPFDGRDSDLERARGVVSMVQNISRSNGREFGFCVAARRLDLLLSSDGGSILVS